MKMLVKILGAVVVLLLLVVIGVFIYLDTIARTAIEKGATYALGVQTTLANANIGVFSGEFSMEGLVVSNPKGFKSEHFLELGRGFVAVTMGSLTKEVVHLPTLTLSTVRMNLEKTGGKSNYEVILDNLGRLQSDQAPTGGKTQPGKQFVVDEILLTDVNVEVDVLPVGGELNRVKVPIDEIRLSGVGPEGLTTSQITDLVIKAIMAAVAKSAVDLPADLVNDLGPALASLSDWGVNSTVDIGGRSIDVVGSGVTGTVNEAGKKLEDVGKGIGDGIGGLFGGKKKEE